MKRNPEGILPTIVFHADNHAYALLVYGGMRREEVLGLHWEDVFLDEGRLKVEWVVTYPGNNQPVVEHRGKSVSSIRDVIMPQPLVAILRPLSKPHGFVIGKSATSPQKRFIPGHDGALSYQMFVKHIEASGKEFLGLTSNNHDWRTTYGSQLKESGMTSAQVADLMGHADTRMVETVYARRRTSGVMKQKNVLEELNSAYIV